jgi:hypothetical protein
MGTNNTTIKQYREQDYNEFCVYVLYVNVIAVDVTCKLETWLGTYEISCSRTGTITLEGRKVHLLWEQNTKKIDDQTCTCIHATAADEFLTFVENNGIAFETSQDCFELA